MYKKFAIGLGILLLVLNAGVIVCPDGQATAGVKIFSSIAGLTIVLIALRAKSVQADAPACPATVVPPQPLPAPRPEAEIVSLLALLQEHGRLVDFVQEDIAGATDQQVGSAARVVHAGCKKVLQDYFDVQPLRSESEGAEVVLTDGFDASAHRLLGSVPNRPPYRGKLVHPGWKTLTVELPRLTGTTDSKPWPAIAPAEIEIS